MIILTAEDLSTTCELSNVYVYLELLATVGKLLLDLQPQLAGRE